MELATNGMFGFSIPDSERNKAAKGKRTRKVRDKESSGTEGRQFF